MVESDGIILLVIQEYELYWQHRAYSFAVFRLDLLTLSWVRMNKNGNQVLFLGHRCSVSLPAAQIRYKENHIYFVSRDDKDGSCWVLNMEDGSIKSGLTCAVASSYLKPMCITPSFI